MTQGTVIRIDQYPRDTSAGAFSGSTTHNISLTREDAVSLGGSQGSATLVPSDLYPTLGPDDGEIIQAIALLGRCMETLESARQINDKTDFIAYDEEMMRVRQELRQLFQLRQIGDGFGATVNAVLWALQNKDPERLSQRQLSVVVETLGQLRLKPLLHFDTAMTLMDQLEDSDLDIDRLHWQRCLSLQMSSKTSCYIDTDSPDGALLKTSENRKKSACCH